MQAKRRALSRNRSLACAGLVACLAAVCLIGVAPAKAGPFDIFWSDPLSVPPFKGNDTGGIIAWQYAQQIDARRLAADHCASYGKLAKRLATQPYYGGYISFACYWPRGAQIVRVY